MPSATAFDPKAAETTLFGALLAAARQHGHGRIIVEDAGGTQLSYRDLIRGSLVLGAKFAARIEPREAAGLLLPTTGGLVLTLFALNAFNRVAALLNFTSGTRNILAAARIACVRTVITSRQFVASAKLGETVAALAAAEAGPGRPIEILYLEDLRAATTFLDKLAGLCRALAAEGVHRRYGGRPEDPALILFTSGTEGTPKGAVLTNANIAANASQVFAHAAGVLSPADTWMNPLPMFHAFGLTAGTLVPLFHGIKAVLHPSPLRYREIAALARKTHPTILLATDTFLQGYARAAHGGDFASLRFVIAGAERVKPETRALWQKLGIPLLEGYGVTECAPVVSFNLPDSNRPGTAGRLLPGIEAKITPVAGITAGGRLFLRGPNVMAGYLDAAQPGKLVPPPGGWHDTGDIVTLNDGFLRIHGRLKRFAKIGGEMISLNSVETLAADLWPDVPHAAVAVPEAKKGEQIVLVTEKSGAARPDLLSYARQKGLPELWIPKAVLVVEKLPLLGSGKADLAAIEEIARRRVVQNTEGAGNAGRDCGAP